MIDEGTDGMKSRPNILHSGLFGLSEAFPLSRGVRSVLFIVLLFQVVTGCSQKVLLSGTAIAGSGPGSVMISVNDTFRKLAKNDHYNSKQFNKLYFNNRYNVHTDHQKRFKIKAKKTDSLYFIASGYFPQAYLVNDLLKRGNINIQLEPLPCDTVKCREDAVKFYVLIANKTKLTNVSTENCPQIVTLDGVSKYEAEYAVIQNISGNYPNSAISFTLYFEYGVPAFKTHENALLYIGEYCGRLVHLRNLVTPIFKTDNGRWAAPYSIRDYNYKDENVTIKPEIIPFAEPVEFDINKVSKEWVSKVYPSPYYKIHGDKAIAVYGNYVEDIFELKKQTVLKDRKYFD